MTRRGQGMGLVRQMKLAVMRRVGRTLGIPGVEARLAQLEMRGPIADARLDQCEQAVPAAMRAQRIATDLEKRADLHFQQLFDIVERASRRQMAYAEAAEARFATAVGRLDGIDRALAAAAATIQGSTERIDAVETALSTGLAGLDSRLCGVRDSVGTISERIAAGFSDMAEINGRVAELGARLDDGVRDIGAIAENLAQSEARLVIGEDAVGRMSARLDDNDAMIGRLEGAVGRLREESEVCRSMVNTIRQWIDAVDDAAEGEDRKQALLKLRAHVSDLEARMNLFHGERINLIRHFLFGAVEDRVRDFVPFSSLES